ncbi:hypothetical protein A7U60_g7800 [Sanghuangporus baumii]|uniref:Uncharacterized protein n=1 Tax=Sanghuangporus baumii TaxID=108892 RepID=A0A9Q5N990_SANBA|nr:hypothetical protein A7U60_g7800 [Sanghuangporus baumii]
MLYITLAVTASSAFVTASPSVGKRQLDTSVLCGQFDSSIKGPYTLLLDQFGSSGATSGSQCAQVTALSGRGLRRRGYDLFTSTSPDGDNINEIMVWLANINAGPISDVFNAQRKAVPAVTNIGLEGDSWNLFIGSNGANNVFSFLPTSGTIQSFSADINSFLKFLIANEGLPDTQFL